MAAEQLSQVVRQLRSMVAHQESAGIADADLLKRYVHERDEAAFETLMRRHGPMVLGVCRRLLHNPHDAEDAFQVTFLVLVRKASALRAPGTIGNWLYGVAHRTALEARRASAKRRAKEAKVIPERELPQDGREELWAVLDEELKRLPDKHREVVVLCDLEGKTRKEAAQDLDCAEGTVASRLARARTVLAKRLTQHGVTVSGGALAILLSENAASAMPPSLVSSTIQAATAYAAGLAATAGAISTNVIALTHGVLRAMLLTKLKISTAVLLTVAVVGVGAGSLIYQAQAAREANDQGDAVQRTAQDSPRPQGEDPAKNDLILHRFGDEEKKDNLKAAAPAGEDITVEAMPPVVVKTVPQAGVTNVDANTSEIRVTFSKDMTDGSWSWSQLSDDSFPKIMGKPRYQEDKRTCVITVKLEPDKTYAIWLNSEKFGNFKDAGGRSAVPYLLVFKTAK